MIEGVAKKWREQAWIAALGSRRRPIHRSFNHMGILNG
jgi:hypothetical protein